MHKKVSNCIKIFQIALKYFKLHKKVSKMRKNF